jgi:tripartite-type tricarboxylate transporter receptor subunit TctC
MMGEGETKMHAFGIPTMIAVSFMLFGVSIAVAQSYPIKPIRLIVAWGPGGAPDIFARIVGDKLYTQMGQPVIVDNRPGATGNIGAEIVAKARPDGYTIFNATLSLAISPAFYRKLPFDPMANFAPVTMLASVPLILVVNPGLPTTSVPELVALAKSKPGSLNYASVGNGSPQHVSAELFQIMAGGKLVHVPYKSGGGMVAAILSGETQLAFIAIAPALPHVKAGRLRVLAITATKRSPAVPDAPTFAEVGLPGIEADNWNGILAPAGTPKSVINRLHAEIVKAVRAPEVAEQFVRQGAEVNTSSSAEFSSVIKAEVKKWAKVVKASGIKPQ